jgi:hypothetical protein
VENPGVRFFLIAAALAAVVVPAVAQPSAVSKGAPIRIAMSLPHDGNASTALLKVPIVHTGTGGKLSVVVRAEKRLPKKYFGTYRAVVKGSNLYIGPTFVLPHALDTSAPIPAGQSTFDTTIFTAYTPGVVGAGGDNTQVVDIFVFDDGHPLLSNDPADRCPSCSFHLTVGGKKTLLRLDDVLSPHKSPPGCKLGFGVIVVGGDSGPPGLQGFVTNSSTGTFDLSVFGSTPAEIGGNVEAGIASLACGGSTPFAKRLRDRFRPARAPTGFTLTVDATHHHGAGESNLCVRARTSPAQSGNAVLTLDGPSGAETKTVLLGPGGSAIGVFGITQYGSYTGSAKVGSKLGSTDYTVDAGSGQAFACPGP